MSEQEIEELRKERDELDAQIQERRKLLAEMKADVSKLPNLDHIRDLLNKARQVCKAAQNFQKELPVDPSFFDSVDARAIETLKNVQRGVTKLKNM